MKEKKQLVQEIIEVEKNCLVTIEIPNFTEYVQLSKARRVKPYIKDKCRIPKKYLTDDYGWLKKGRNIVLCQLRDNIPLIANSKSAGTPRYKKVNGQDIYNGNVSRQSRATLVKALHTFFKKYISLLSPITDSTKYPLTIKSTFYIKDNGKHNIDNDNKWIWEKVIQDTLTECKIIPDDNPYIIDENIKKTVLIDNEEDQKLIIEIYGKR